MTMASSIAPRSKRPECVRPGRLLLQWAAVALLLAGLSGCIKLPAKVEAQFGPPQGDVPNHFALRPGVTAGSPKRGQAQ